MEVWTVPTSGEGRLLLYSITVLCVCLFVLHESVCVIEQRPLDWGGSNTCVSRPDPKPGSVHWSPRKWNNPVAKGHLTTVPNKADHSSLSQTASMLPLHTSMKPVPNSCGWSLITTLNLALPFQIGVSKIDPRELKRASTYLFTCAWSLIEKLLWGGGDR